MANSSKTLGKLTIPLLVLLAICFSALPAQAKYGGGTGEPNDPYLIFDANQMNAIGANSNDWDKHFILMADIDLAGFTGTEFNIIGTDYDNPFTGVFDGSGHTISNFSYTSTGTKYIGLFGYVRAPNAEIKDLGLIDPNVDAGRESWVVGSLVGANWDGTITNCYVEGGSVSGDSIVGGLVGYNWAGTINNCSSSSSITGTSGIGGLVGHNYEEGTISNCSYSTGSVSGTFSVGGLVGNNYRGTITNSYSNGSVSGTTNVGGLVGCNYGTITNCYSSGGVSGNHCVGGLVGENYRGTITNCYSTGSVSGDNNVGGLVGFNEAEEVIGSFWDTETSGQSTSAGGTGKTTAEMQMASTFFVWACSGGSVWTIDEGNDYPRLWWENAPGEPITTPSYGGGSGEPNDPYLIYTAEQLNMIGLFPCDWDKHFKLMADIDLSGYTGTAFNIIGYFVRWYLPDNKPFTGTFDGNGKNISNFSYTCTDTNARGLFSYVGDPNAEIKDLRLIAPDVNAGTGEYIGSLVGWIDNGTITNCYVEDGSVTGMGYVGELVGSNVRCTISNSYSTGSVSGGWCVGGLVGENQYDGTITNCYSEADASGTWYTDGGLVGSNRGTITNCYSTGSVSGTVNIGGLVGYNLGTITNCYAEGNASGNTRVGGLVGSIREGTISNCYATCSASGNKYVGGLVGYNYMYPNVLFLDSFWDIQTSGQTTSVGGWGKTTARMQILSTFTKAGWDFTTPVWTIDEGVDYPRLWWETPMLHAEPEITLGTSNTISWDPVVGAIEYYAECAEDANFTNVLYNSGWITETSYEFTDLELGQRYWYSVKARNIASIETDWSNVESSLQETLADAVDAMLDPDTLKNKNMKNALSNKINAVQQMLDEGFYAEALNKLQNDILTKTNGCAETGEPDKNDWIITCEGQSVVYPLVIETIENVKGLMQ